MIGLGLLVRLGRQVLAGPVADAGILPAKYYRHLVLAALEEEDFPRALHHLKWANNPLLAQIIILRLRLLAARHQHQAAAVQDLKQRPDLTVAQRERCQALLDQETRAVELLQGYEDQALVQMHAARQSRAEMGPSRAGLK
jgi:hypothetical protein